MQAEEGNARRELSGLFVLGSAFGSSLYLCRDMFRRNLANLPVARVSYREVCESL